MTDYSYCKRIEADVKSREKKREWSLLKALMKVRSLASERATSPAPQDRHFQGCIRLSPLGAVSATLVSLIFAFRWILPFCLVRLSSEWALKDYSAVV